MTKVSQLKEEWADREAIRECLYTYARAIDRCDMELMKSVYWPGAMDYHTGFSGTAEEFMAWASAQMAAMGQNMHLFGNILIDLDGPTANVESYHWFIIASVGGSGRDTVGCGRYLDRFERRDDEWRIAERLVLVDWFREYPDTVDWIKGPFGMPDVPRGLKGRDDPSYAWFSAKP